MTAIEISIGVTSTIYFASVVWAACTSTTVVRFDKMTRSSFILAMLGTVWFIARLCGF